MKDQIDVTVRRSPKYSVFIGLGAIFGILVAGVLTLFVDPATIPAGYTVAKGAGMLLMVLGIGGAFLGGLVALVLDWSGKKKARKFRVGAEIDIVDDPKEIARQRIAEMKGEPVSQFDPAEAEEGSERNDQGASADEARESSADDDEAPPRS